MSLTVGITTYRSRQLIGPLLDSLPDGLAGVPEWRLVVVDSGSDDGTIELIRERMPDAEIVDMGANRGFAAGVNRFDAADPDSDAVLILSPTVRLDPGTAKVLLEALADPAVGIAVPRLRNGDGRLSPSLRRRPTFWRTLGEAVLGGRRAGRFPALAEMVADPAVYEVPSTADWATGAVTMVSRSCLDAVGPWDESFFLYSEETDFELRAADQGFVLRLAPDAESVHLGGESQVRPALSALLAVNKVRLYARRNGRVSAVAFWAAVVLGAALRSVKGSRADTHRAALRRLLRERASLLCGEPATETLAFEPPAVRPTR